MTLTDPTAPEIILASSSQTRRRLLERAGLQVTFQAPRIDEPAFRASLAQQGVVPRDMADHLAEQKARKIAERYPSAIVIGCDQVLDLDGRAYGKPDDLTEAQAQLSALRSRTHALHTAIVVYESAQPVWRHVDTARLTMRAFSDVYLQGYLARHWPGVASSPGCYRIEEEGIRLFSQIEGDHFSILGLPLLPLLDYLARRRWMET